MTGSESFQALLAPSPCDRGRDRRSNCNSDPRTRARA
jgi:hypothetical protein